MTRQALSATVDGVSTNLYAYDVFGNLTNEVQNGATIARTYDTFGRPTGYALGGFAPSREVHYAYDPLGRFASVSVSAGGSGDVPRPLSTFAYSYLPGSDLVSGYTCGFSRSVSYEPHRDLISAVTNIFNDSTPSTPSTISTFDYANDAAGRRVLRLDTFDGAITTNVFGYNTRSEVTSALMGTNTYGYAYDPIGNRIESYHNAETNSYTANNLNQYTSIDTAEPTYDADGNMTSDGRGWHYVWNGENRMVTASNDAVVVTYAYDHRGRMVRKEISHRDTETQSIAYTWDNWNIIREALVTRHSPLVTHNVWGLDIDGTLQGAGGVGGLLAVIRAEADSTNSSLVTRSSSLYLPTYDANGNISEYVATNGTIAAHYVYSPFGESCSHPSVLESLFGVRFSTKPWCPYTDFSEYEFRKYNSITGRWLSRDPVEEDGGLNLYNHKFNDFVSHVDYLGLSANKFLDFIILKPPATPWKCGCVAVAYSSWALTTPINWLLWNHWIDGSGENLLLHYSDFDPTYANRAAAKYVVSIDVRGTRGLAEHLKCGQSRTETHSFAWGALSLPDAMILQWVQRTKYVLTYGKTCDSDNCCKEVWANADIEFHAHDRVDFNPGGPGIFLPPFYIYDDLVNECFNINGELDFDIDAYDNATIKEKWECRQK